MPDFAREICLWIHLHYLFSYANHTSEVLCLLKSFTQYFIQHPEKLYSEKNYFFLNLCLKPFPILFMERKCEHKDFTGQRKGPLSPPYRFPNVSLDYFSHNIRYGHEMVLLQQIIVKNRRQKTRWSVLTVVQAHQCNKAAVNAKV